MRNMIATGFVLLLVACGGASARVPIDVVDVPSSAGPSPSAGGVGVARELEDSQGIDAGRDAPADAPREATAHDSAPDVALPQTSDAYCYAPQGPPSEHLTWGVYPICGGGPGLDVAVQCTIAGALVTWRCSSGTPNPCPPTSTCCAAAYPNPGACHGRTTRACAGSSECTPAMCGPFGLASTTWVCDPF